VQAGHQVKSVVLPAPLGRSREDLALLHAQVGRCLRRPGPKRLVSPRVSRNGIVSPSGRAAQSETASSDVPPSSSTLRCALGRGPAVEQHDAGADDAEDQEFEPGLSCHVELVRNRCSARWWR